jgi:hypothetical protein
MPSAHSTLELVYRPRASLWVSVSCRLLQMRATATVLLPLTAQGGGWCSRLSACPPAHPLQPIPWTVTHCHRPRPACGPAASQPACARGRRPNITTPEPLACVRARGGIARWVQIPAKESACKRCAPPSPSPGPAGACVQAQGTGGGGGRGRAGTRIWDSKKRWTFSRFVRVILAQGPCCAHRSIGTRHARTRPAAPLARPRPPPPPRPPPTPCLRASRQPASVRAGATPQHHHPRTARVRACARGDSAMGADTRQRERLQALRPPFPLPRPSRRLRAGPGDGWRGRQRPCWDADLGLHGMAWYSMVGLPAVSRLSHTRRGLRRRSS